jgi:hypothetical protein
VNRNPKDRPSLADISKHPFIVGVEISPEEIERTMKVLQENIMMPEENERA